MPAPWMKRQTGWRELGASGGVGGGDGGDMAGSCWGVEPLA